MPFVEVAVGILANSLCPMQQRPAGGNSLSVQQTRILEWLLHVERKLRRKAGAYRLWLLLSCKCVVIALGRKQSIARNPQPCAAASGPIGPMLPSVAAIPSSSGGLLLRGHTSVLSTTGLWSRRDFLTWQGLLVYGHVGIKTGSEFRFLRSADLFGGPPCSLF